MKKTGKIWLLSIIPGLGHFALGDVRMGLVFLASIVFLGLFMVFSPSETVFIICLVLGIIVWSYQWVHAVTMAERKAKEASGLALGEREVMIAPLPADASRAEKRVHKTRLAVMRLLPPGESIKAAIYASKGSYSLASILMALLFDSGPAGNETGVVYLGVTESDFLFIDTDLLGKPSELYRVPIDQVSLVKFKQGGLSDELVITIGETGPLQVSVGHAFRQQVGQLIQILNGAQLSQESTRVDGKPAEVPSPLTFGRLLLMGTGAALVGNAVGFILSIVMIALLMSPELIEGSTFAVGFLCMVLGLPVSLAFGALAAWLGPILSRSRLNSVRKATLLVGSFLGIATWVIISVLTILFG